MLLCVCAVISGAEGWEGICAFGRTKLVKAVWDDDFRANLVFQQ